MRQVRAVITDERVRSKRWNACAVFTSFIITFFNLIALGIPWYYKPGCDTTLLYCVQRVTGFALRAGNAAVVFVFIGFILQYIATFAVYTRWGGRTSFIPHGPAGCAVWFALSSLAFLLSVSIYAGIVNGTEDKAPGAFGPGFVLACIICIVDALSAVGVYIARNEIGDKGVLEDVPAHQLHDETPVPQAESGGRGGKASGVVRGAVAAVRGTVKNAQKQWGKAHVHSIVLLLALLNLIIVIICLGTSWWNSQGNDIGLIQQFYRLPKSGDLADMRKAGDRAFAFTVLAFFTELYAVIATTVRFLGRNDTFSGRIPHSLAVCVTMNALGSLWLLVAFAVYADKYDVKSPNLVGSVGGGFALIVLDFILSLFVILVLIFARKEVSVSAPPSTTAAREAYPDDTAAV